jgi:hypothetical protein
MPITSLANIKNWFRTGLKPTQAQFWDTLDSFWHKEDQIPMSNVQGLNTTLNTFATKTYVDNEISTVLAAGVAPPSYQLVNPGGQLQVVWELVTRIVVQPQSGFRPVFRIGTTINGGEVYDGPIEGGKPLILTQAVYFNSLPGVLYFSGFSQFTYVQIWYT